MIITIIAVLCAQSVCHKEVVSQGEGAIGLGCLVAEAQTLTEWKQHSIYRGTQWSVERVMCIAGNDYRIKERT